jgi:phosphoenolpyruvate synthase/pyruvate phosphate dikinase
MHLLVKPQYTLHIEDINSSNYSLAGQEGYERFVLKNLGLNSAKIFFVTDQAFYEVFTSLGLLYEISKLHKNSKKLERTEILKNIYTTIEESDIDNIILAELEESLDRYKILESDPMLEIRLSNSDIVKHYIENSFPQIINNKFELAEIIKKTWNSIFKDPHLVREFITTGGLNQITVQVLKVLPYEIMGHVYAYKNLPTVEVNATYGIWLNDKYLNAYDVYTIQKDKNKVIDIKIGNQNKMVVRNGNSLVETEVAPSWQSREKLSQSQIKKVVDAAKKLETYLHKSVEFSFGFYKGELYIHDLKTINSISKNEDNATAPDHSIKQLFELPEERELFVSKPADENHKLLHRLKTVLGEESDNSADKKRSFKIINNLVEKDILKDKDLYKGSHIAFQNIVSNKTLFQFSNDYDLLIDDVDESAAAFYKLDFKELIINIDTKNGNLVKDNHLIITAFEYLNQLKERYDFQNISTSISSISSVDFLEVYIDLISKYKELYIKEKLYLTLDTLSLLSQIAVNSGAGLVEILENIVIDFNELIKSYYNKSKFTKNEVENFILFLSGYVNDIKRLKFNVYIKFEGANELLGRISSLNPNGFILNSN